MKKNKSYHMGREFLIVVSEVDNTTFTGFTGNCILRLHVHIVKLDHFTLKRVIQFLIWKKLTSAAFSEGLYCTLAEEKLKAPNFVGLTTTIWDMLVWGGILSILTFSFPPATLNESSGKLSSLMTTSWAGPLPTL